MTKLANMAVLDKLQKLDKDSGTDHVNHWQNLKSTDKVSFALQLKLDKDDNFMSVTESHAQTNTMKNAMLTGWHIEAQVFAQENIHQWSYCDSQKQILADILGWGCQSGPMRHHM